MIPQLSIYEIFLDQKKKMKKIKNRTIRDITNLFNMKKKIITNQSE